MKILTTLSNKDSGYLAHKLFTNKNWDSCNFKVVVTRATNSNSLNSAFFTGLELEKSWLSFELSINSVKITELELELLGVLSSGCNHCEVHQVARNHYFLNIAIPDEQ